MSWEERKHTRRFLEIVLSVGDTTDAGSTHTSRDNERKDDLNGGSAAVTVTVESSPSSAVRRRRRR